MPKRKKCNVCWKIHCVTKCFLGCSWYSCDDCLIKQIKVSRKIFGRSHRALYKCPHCRKDIQYIPKKNIGSPRWKDDKIFTKWCKNRSNAMDKIISEIITPWIEQPPQLEEYDDEYYYNDEELYPISIASPRPPLHSSSSSSSSTLPAPPPPSSSSSSPLPASDVHVGTQSVPEELSQL